MMIVASIFGDIIGAVAGVAAAVFNATAPVAGALVMGAVTKRASIKYDVNRPGLPDASSHQIGAPVVAAITAGIVSAMTGNTETLSGAAEAGGVYGLVAVGAHSTSKHLWKWVKGRK